MTDLVIWGGGKGENRVKEIFYQRGHLGLIEIHIHAKSVDSGMINEGVMGEKK